MGEIVWMGRRSDTGEVEEVGRGPSLQVPGGYEHVWWVVPELQWRPNVVATSSDGTVTVAFAHESEAPSTISELPEVVQGEQVIEVLGGGWPGAQPLPPSWQPPRVEPLPTLTAAEVTEPGWYWYREDAGKAWSVVHYDDNGLGQGWFFVVEQELPHLADEMPGTFVGPLRAPE